MHETPQPLHVLIVEDNPEDAELIALELRRSGFEPNWQRVDTEEDFLVSLEGDLDVILSDYKMPQFDGLRALELVKQRGLEVPFIIVSGTIGEETAVEAMKQGAADYLLKDRLARLGPAVAHGLEQSRLHKEHKEAEAALRDSEDRFRQLAENIQEVFWITDVAKNQMLYVSPAYERIWGRSHELLYHSPHSWFDAIHPEDHERVLQAALTKRVMGTYDEEYCIRQPNGSIRWIHDRAFPVRNAVGEVHRVVGIAQDMTERRQLEMQFRQAQKLESVGRLAGGIAHDFNNLLTVINGLSELILTQLEAANHLRSSIEQINKAGERAAVLTQQLLAFSRKQVLEPKILNLNSVVGNIEKMLGRLIGEDVELITVMASDLKHVKADPGQIEQVLVNLAVNARDAMPEGGKLTIETANVQLDESFVLRHHVVRPGSYVLLAISDNGCGMSEEVQANAFEPFFTTKELGKGTGLGLSTVYGIVKQSEGYIWLYSEPGSGTSFKIYLPQVQGEAESTVSLTASLETMSGTETILLVEDESVVRTLVRTILQGKGYTVLEAGDGKQAIQLSSLRPGKIDLLITDTVMPRMSGPMLSERLKPTRPETKVLYMSGYTDHSVISHDKLITGGNFLQKPFRPDDLARKVREVLNTE